jgi:hypothetical protein
LYTSLHVAVTLCTMWEHMSYIEVSASAL